MNDRELLELAAKAARLAAVYGDDWNSLSQESRMKYVECVEVIASVAELGRARA